MFLFDTIGISVFTLLGLQKGLSFNLPPFIALIMGMVSAVFGGVIRDGEGLIPLGDFEIHEGDRVVVCCLPRSIAEVEKFFA